MVVFWTLGAVALFGLTIWSFFRTAKGKKLPVLYGVFWKTVTVMLVLSATWFSQEIPEAGWLMLALAAGLGALLYFFPCRPGVMRKPVQAHKAEPDRKPGEVHRRNNKPERLWSPLLFARTRRNGPGGTPLSSTSGCGEPFMT